MHKSILMFLLAVVSSNAVAEWVEIASNDSITYYADHTTIRKSGNNVKMWAMIDYNSAQKAATGKFLSIKGHNEYDCKEKQLKAHYYSKHSENMGRGDVVYTNDKSDKNWSPVIPDSTGEFMWKYVCGY